MGFFNDFKRNMEAAEQRRLEREKHEEYIPPGEKMYQPGHKNKSGYAKKDALINLLGISDLDEVIEGCAPEFTKAVYGIRDTVIEAKKGQETKSRYDELLGRYNELRKHYDELQENYQELVKIMASNKSVQR